MHTIHAGEDAPRKFSGSGYDITPLTQDQRSAAAADLTEFQRYVTLEHGTERAFTGAPALSGPLGGGGRGMCNRAGVAPGCCCMAHSVHSGLALPGLSVLALVVIAVLALVFIAVSDEVVHQGTCSSS